MFQRPTWKITAVYFGTAMVFAVFHILATRGAADWRWSVIIGTWIGTWAGVLLLAGILPLILWIFGFRSAAGGVPLIAWGVIALVFGSAVAGDDFYEGAATNVPGNISAFFSDDTQTFVRVVKTSCIQSRGPNSHSTLSAEGFARFCQCYADAVLQELTPQEFAMTRDARGVPAVMPIWLREKMGRAAIACQNFAISH